MLPTVAATPSGIAMIKKVVNKKTRNPSSPIKMGSPEVRRLDLAAPLVSGLVSSYRRSLTVSLDHPVFA